MNFSMCLNFRAKLFRLVEHPKRCVSRVSEKQNVQLNSAKPLKLMVTPDRVKLKKINNSIPGQNGLITLNLVAY